MKKFNLVISIIKSLMSGACVAFSTRLIPFATYFRCKYVNYKTYGGDAYTGIQNAAADAANNVYELARWFSDVITCIGFISAFAFLALFLHNFEAVIKNCAELRTEANKKRNEKLLSYIRENSNPIGNPNFGGNQNPMHTPDLMGNSNITAHPDSVENQNINNASQAPENIEISNNNDIPNN